MRNGLPVEGMIGREALPAMRVTGLGHHDRSELLGHSHERVDGFGFHDTAASENGRRLRFKQYGAGLLQGRHRRAHAPVDRFRRSQVQFGSCHLNVEGQRQKHRAGRRSQGQLDGPPDGRRQIFDPFDFHGPFRPGARDLYHVAP